MAKVICAFPGIASGALFILLKMENKEKFIVRDMSGNTDSLERMVQGTDVLILRATTAVVEKLNSLGQEFDLVYPDPAISPNRFTSMLAMEGWRLGEIHDMVYGWKEQLAALQSFTNTNVNHIVLDEGKTLLDTHGINKDEQCS